MDRHLELFGLRWAIRLRSTANNLWKSHHFGWGLILCSGLGYLYWSYHIPSPGKAVAALAVLAAVMTFRGEIGGLEKFFWMLVLFAFLFMELKAIDRDRAAYAIEQSNVREGERRAFQEIADGLKNVITQNNTTLGEVKTMLATTETTQRNTQPFALLEFQQMLPYGPSLPIKVGHSLKFNVQFTNSGNDVAVHNQFAAKFYLGKPHDEQTEIRLAHEFDKWWAGNKHQVEEVYRPHIPAVLSVDTDPFTDTDIKGLLDHTLTLYTFIRFVYSDHTGRWVGDECLFMQDHYP